MQRRAHPNHMFMAGEALATGIATQLPDAFPADAPAPATDADVYAHMSNAPIEPMAFALAIVAVAAGLTLLAMRDGGRGIRRAS